MDFTFFPIGVWHPWLQALDNRGGGAVRHQLSSFLYVRRPGYTIAPWRHFGPEPGGQICGTCLLRSTRAAPQCRSWCVRQPVGCIRQQTSPGCCFQHHLPPLGARHNRKDWVRKWRHAPSLRDPECCLLHRQVQRASPTPCRPCRGRQASSWGLPETRPKEVNEEEPTKIIDISP